MSLSKSPTEVINVAAKTAGTSTAEGDCLTTNLEKRSQLCIEAVITFQAASTGNATVHIRCSSLDTDAAFLEAVDYGAVEDGNFTVTCDVGKTVRKSVPVWCDALYMRFIVDNDNDDTVDIVINVIEQEVAPT